LGLSKDELKHLGWLSRIDLSDEELERYATQIEQVIRYLDVLDSVSTPQQNPSESKKKLTELREDKVEDFQSDALGTLYRKDGFVKGPRMGS